MQTLFPSTWSSGYVSCLRFVIPHAVPVMARRQTTHDDTTAIITLVKAGHSLPDISRQTSVPLRTVQRLVKRFREEGAQDIPVRRPRSGRPRIVSPRTVRVLQRQVEHSPKKTAREFKLQNPRLLGSASLRTVQRRLHDDVGVRRYRSKRKPLLSRKNLQDRIKFCKKYSTWTDSDWKKVLWSDESTFTVTSTIGSGVYRKPGSDPHLAKYTTKTVKHPASVMVWGCFSYHGVGNLVFLPADVRMDRKMYLELLCDNLPECFEKTNSDIFMQDGAPCHTAKYVKEWLEDCEVNFFKDWPGSSPDINPIENLWSLMKRRLCAMDTGSVPKLEAAISEVWNNLPQDLIQNLAASVPRRLKECLKRKGAVTKY